MGHPATGHPALTDIQLFGHPTLPDIQLYRTSSSSGHPALSDIQLYQISSSIGHPTLSDIQHYQNFHLFQTSSSIEHPAGRHETVENHHLGLFLHTLIDRMNRNRTTYDTIYNSYASTYVMAGSKIIANVYKTLPVL